VAVDHVDALAAAHDPARRLAVGMVLEVGRGMEEVGPVHGLEVRDVRLERRFGWHGDILQAASTTAMQTYFSAVSSSSPWREPSRPGPGCCTPPNGIGAAHPDAVEGDHAVFGRRGHARDPVHI